MYPPPHSFANWSIDHLELRRKAEEEETLRKIEEQALKEINEEKKRLAALLTNPSTL